jgi:hypothetical protein
MSNPALSRATWKSRQRLALAEAMALDKRLEGFAKALSSPLEAASHYRCLTAYQQAILLAAIIEVALLNCTHVLAVMTGMGFELRKLHR